MKEENKEAKEEVNKHSDIYTPPTLAGCFTGIVGTFLILGIIFLIIKGLMGLEKEHDSLASLLIIGIPLSIYLLYEGTRKIKERGLKLIFFSVVVLIFGGLLTKCDGGSSLFCAFRVGCF